MSNQQTILRPDDFNRGMIVTVLNGDSCPAGCCERYQHFKGIPLLILEVDLPYLVCAVAGGNFTHLDVTDCDLKRVTEPYAALFGVVKAPKEPEATDGQT